MTSEQLTVPRVIWAALFGSTLVYVAVLELTTGLGEPRWEILVTPLLVAGATSAGASLVLPRVLLQRHRVARRDSTAAPKDPAGAYLVTLILALALAESIAIFGLVLGLQGAPPKVVMPFFALAWVLMIVRFPTAEKLDEFQ